MMNWISNFLNKKIKAADNYASRGPAKGAEAVMRRTGGYQKMYPAGKLPIGWDKEMAKRRKEMMK